MAHGHDQSSENSGGGFSDFASGFGIGASTGNAIGDIFVNTIEGKRDAAFAARQERRAFQGSLSGMESVLGLGGFNLGPRQVVLNDLAGLTTDDLRSFQPSGNTGPQSAIGGMINRPGQQESALERLSRMGIRSDQVVARDSFEARFVPAGTVIARRPGDRGMDPRVLKSRSLLYGLLSRGGLIDSGQETAFQTSSAAQLNAQLTANSGVENVQGLAGLAGLGAAGTTFAQNEMQTDLINRQFNAQAQNAANSFLQRIYSSARGVT